MAIELFQSKLQASDGANNHNFGRSVSVSGNIALVGAQNFKAAYLLELQGDGSWEELQKLTGPGAYFGCSVSIDGNFAIVGAYNYNKAWFYERDSKGEWKEVQQVAGTSYFGISVSISGNFAIVGAYNSNRAYFYERKDGKWEETEVVTGPGNYFGWSVSISENLAIVGAYNHNAAYFYERKDGKWEKVQEVKGKSGSFGYSVSISRNVAIVGAHQERTDFSNQGAAYLFERQGNGDWKEVAKVVASDAEATDYFGFSVAVDGNVALVGAYYEDTGGSNIGAAYQFQRHGNGNWVEIAKLQAEDGKANDQFGYSVALDAGLALVGALNGDGKVANTGTAYSFYLPRESNIGQALTYNVVANDADAGDKLGSSVSLSGKLAGVGAPGEGNKAGAAYLFERSTYGFWEQMQKVVAYDREPNDDFGRSISLDGSLVAVGAPNESDGAGAVYLFEQQSDEAWQLVQKLVAFDAQPKDYFGHAVSLDGNSLMVGAYAEGDMAGAVYPFERQEDGRWKVAYTQKLTARGENKGFGKSLLLDGERLIVGADIDDNETPGAAYLFKRESDGTWKQTDKVQASDKKTNDHFGHSVWLDGKLAIVGAYGQGSGAPDEGAAYIFGYKRGGWTQKQKIMACDRRARDRFGYSVSLNGSVAAVGAFYNNAYGDNGGVYLFQQLSNGIWVEAKKLVDGDQEEQNNFAYALSQDGNFVMIGAPLQDAGPENAGAAVITQYQEAKESETETKPDPVSPTKMASGSTEAGSTDWQDSGDNEISVDVDTSGVGFSETPKYFTTLGGAKLHRYTRGVTSIHNPSKDGFTVKIKGDDKEISAQLARDNQWHVNWFAVGPDGGLPC